MGPLFKHERKSRRFLQQEVFLSIRLLCVPFVSILLYKVLFINSEEIIQQTPYLLLCLIVQKSHISYQKI